MTTLARALSFFTGQQAAPRYDKRLFRVPRKYVRSPLTERDLLTLESRVGAEIFGPIPEGHRRQFFCLDEETWVWSDISDDEAGHHETIIRYEIHDTGILKVLGDHDYTFLGGDELRRFVVAVQMYYERVARDIYKRDPKSGERLAHS